MERTRVSSTGSRARRAARGIGHVYLLTADENSLAELEAALQALPYCARGRVFVEVETAEQITRIDAPSRMTVTWLTRATRTGAPGSGRRCASGEAVARAVCAWADEMLCGAGDTPHVWLGGHYRGVSAVHEHLTQTLGVPPASIAAPLEFRLRG